MLFHEGPFQTCHSALNLTVLTELCEYDLCISLLDTSLLCDHLEHVATVCSKEELDIADWRQYVTSCRKFFFIKMTTFLQLQTNFVQEIRSSRWLLINCCSDLPFSFWLLTTSISNYLLAFRDRSISMASYNCGFKFSTTSFTYKAEKCYFLNSQTYILNKENIFSSIAKECPDGTIYNPCGTLCTETCGNEMGSLEDCSFTCAETCECEDGQVLSDGICTSREQCGCVLPDGGYLNVTFISRLILLSLNIICISFTEDFYSTSQI